MGFAIDLFIRVFIAGVLLRKVGLLVMVGVLIRKLANLM